MKTYHIKDLLKKELLIVEAKDEKIAWAIIFQKYGVKAVSDYTLLGKPDEIKEEDVKEFVDKVGLNYSKRWYAYENYIISGENFSSALESFHSALESEIYWENPLGVKRNVEKIASSKSEITGKHLIKLWQAAQEKTFDKKKTLIFVRN